MKFKQWLIYENEKNIKKVRIFFTDGVKFLVIKNKEDLWDLPGDETSIENKKELFWIKKKIKRKIGKIKGKQFGTIVDENWISFLYKVNSTFKIEKDIDYKWINFEDKEKYEFENSLLQLLEDHIYMIQKKINETGDLNAYTFTTKKDPDNRIQYLNTDVPKSKKANKIFGKKKKRK